MWADDAPRRVTISETVGVVPQISARRSAIQTVWERILLKQGMSRQGASFFRQHGLCLQCCPCMSRVTALGGTCAVLKGDVEVTCHGVKVRRSRRRRLGWGRGRACHEGSWRGDVMRLAEGHVTGRAGCGSTLLQGSGEGNTKLSSDLSVRGAAYDELTR